MERIASQLKQPLLNGKNAVNEKNNVTKQKKCIVHEKNATEPKIRY